MVNAKRYVGQSTQPRYRCSQHFSIRIKPVTDTNEWLQEDLKKYGKANFTFEIIEHCAKEDLKEREDFYIRTLQPEYNSAIK